MLRVISALSAVLSVVSCSFFVSNAYSDDYNLDVTGYDLTTKTVINTDSLNNEIRKNFIENKNKTELYSDGNVYNKSSRAIIGNDDRMVADINNTGRWANVYIKSVFTDSKKKCSGSLISDNAVLTAAHCVSKNATEYTESVTVYPGRSNGEMPTGFYEVSKVYTIHDWQSDIRGKYDYDMAALIIEPDENGNYPTDKGAPVYSYGYWQVDFTGVSVKAYGYPGDHDEENKTYDVMYEMYNGRVSTMQSDYDKFNNSLDILSGNKKVTSENTLMHSLDTTPGSSGAGILWRYNGQERIIGVNSQQCSTDKDEKVACKDTDGSEILNTAARFTKSSYTQVSTVVSDNEVKK